VGGENWLITVAPYFFPTISLLLIFVFWLLPVSTLGMGEALIGASFAYHLISTLRETHGGQTDVRRAGKLFCLAFLPTANMLTAGVVLSFSHGGAARLAEFVASVFRRSVGLVIGA
jgi:hypothetical protein